MIIKELKAALERADPRAQLRLSIGMDRAIHLVADEPLSLYCGGAAVWSSRDLGILLSAPEKEAS